MGPLSFPGTEDLPVQGQLSTVKAPSPIARYVMQGLNAAIAAPTANSDLATGFFELQLATGYYGTFSFQYQAVAVNGAVSNVGTVTITVQQVLHPPTTYAQTVSTTENTPVSITLQVWPPPPPPPPRLVLTAGLPPPPPFPPAR